STTLSIGSSAVHRRATTSRSSRCDESSPPARTGHRVRFGGVALARETPRRTAGVALWPPWQGRHLHRLLPALAQPDVVASELTPVADVVHERPDEVDAEPAEL